MAYPTGRAVRRRVGASRLRSARGGSGGGGGARGCGAAVPVTLAAAWDAPGQVAVRGCTVMEMHSKSTRNPPAIHTQCAIQGPFHSADEMLIAFRHAAGQAVTTLCYCVLEQGGFLLVAPAAGSPSAFRNVNS